MATLTVWKFPDPETADRSVSVLRDLQARGLVTVHDAASVRWDVGARRPKTTQLHHLAGAGALGGAFWGLLFGLLFFVPLLGAALGAAMGGLTGSLSDAGIDDSFIKEVRSQVTPGTSALFLMTSDVVQDKVREAFVGTHAQLVHTNLDHDQESALRSAFAEE